MVVSMFWYHKLMQEAFPDPRKPRQYVPVVFARQWPFVFDASVGPWQRCICSQQSLQVPKLLLQTPKLLLQALGNAASAVSKAASAGPKAASAVTKAASAGPKAASADTKAASAGPKAASPGPKAASAGPKAASAGPKAASAVSKAASAGPKLLLQYPFSPDFLPFLPPLSCWVAALAALTASPSNCLWCTGGEQCNRAELAVASGRAKRVLSRFLLRLHPSFGSRIHLTPPSSSCWLLKRPRGFADDNPRDLGLCENWRIWEGKGQGDTEDALARPVHRPLWKGAVNMERESIMLAYDKHCILEADSDYPRDGTTDAQEEFILEAAWTTLLKETGRSPDVIYTNVDLECLSVFE
ncbi:hypothetical protein EV702DRAFT_1215288 [Suillus placidus]|uniref:Uncharacterized protein n=1 Tax=Suillus placidus TaxID=48579 RepID=A0A9P6ZG45_9AGAM|nr:hypothetical protein EV702DRAFT_1215288 [Suillus placidus]